MISFFSNNKGLVFHYLNKGYQIIAVGSSIAKGKALLEQANKISADITFHMV